MARRSGGAARRSGPEDEERWWDPADQRLVERATLHRRDLPKKWRHRPLVNNDETIDPFDEIPEGRRVAKAAAARGRTALIDGAALSGPDLQLVVLRIEAFEDADDSVHRERWQEDGTDLMAALYRHRWRERDREPSWIEATWPEFDWELEPRVDWLRVEDHTDRRHDAGLFFYDHLNLWAGRALASLTFRYPPGIDPDRVVVRLADRTLGRLARFETPPGS